MNDRAIGLLEQYEIEVLRTRKGRGAILCDTDKGLLIFKEYTGNGRKAEIQNRLLQHIGEAGSVQTEQIIPTKEGALFVKDNDGISYILKTYKEGRECNIYDRAECLEAVKLLSGLHRCMELGAAGPERFFIEKEYEKHNRELKRVRKYLKQRGQKTRFEIRLTDSFDYFLEQALTVTEEWKTYAGAGNPIETDKVSFCHGDYQHHNIIWDGREWFLINFEKCMADSPVRDLYLFMRKLLEKSRWSVSLGRDLIEAYQSQYPISAFEQIDLYYRLSYPEKFWKIVNFYFNSGKAWIPERNGEKLEKLVAQETEKQKFLNEVFRNVKGR